MQEKSNQATACPHCGYPLRAAVPTTSAAKARKRGTGRLWLLLAVAVFLFVLVLSQRGREPKVETKEDVQLWTITATAMQIRKGMRNPESFVLESVLLIQGTESDVFRTGAERFWWYESRPCGDVRRPLGALIRWPSCAGPGPTEDERRVRFYPPMEQGVR